MHRDLVAMNDRTRASDDKLAGTIEAVHESLKQLVQQMEKPAPQPVAPKPLVQQAEKAVSEPVAPKPLVQQTAKAASEPLAPKPLVQQTAKAASEPVAPKPLVQQAEMAMSEPIAPKPLVQQTAKAASEPIAPKPLAQQVENTAPQPTTPKPRVPFAERMRDLATPPEGSPKQPSAEPRPDKPEIPRPPRGRLCWRSRQGRLTQEQIGRRHRRFGRYRCCAPFRARQAQSARGQARSISTRRPRAGQLCQEARRCRVRRSRRSRGGGATRGSGGGAQGRRAVERLPRAARCRPIRAPSPPPSFQSGASGPSSSFPRRCCSLSALCCSMGACARSRSRRRHRPPPEQSAPAPSAPSEGSSTPAPRRAHRPPSSPRSRRRRPAPDSSELQPEIEASPAENGVGDCRPEAAISPMSPNRPIAMPRRPNRFRRPSRPH